MQKEILENIKFILQEQAESKRELMADLKSAHLLNLRNIVFFQALFGELHKIDPLAIDRVRARLDNALLTHGDEDSFGKMITEAHQIVGLQIDQ